MKTWVVTHPAGHIGGRSIVVAKDKRAGLILLKRELKKNKLSYVKEQTTWKEIFTLTPYAVLIDNGDY